MAVEAEHGQIDEVSRGFDAEGHPGDVSDLGELDLLFLGQILRVFPECVAGVRHVLRFFATAPGRPWRAHLSKPSCCKAFGLF